MNAETIKLQQKAESFKPILEKAGFGELEYFWYLDGIYAGCWSDMSVALDRPEDESHYNHWQFGFRTRHKEDPRIHLQSVVEVFDDWFRFTLSYIPNVELHKRKGMMGPGLRMEIDDILEQDLDRLSEFVEYFSCLKFVMNFKEGDK